MYMYVHVCLLCSSFPVLSPLSLSSLPILSPFPPFFLSSLSSSFLPPFFFPCFFLSTLSLSPPLSFSLPPFSSLPPPLSSSVVAMAYGRDLNSLTFVGVMGMWDPPRDSVNLAITSLHSSGVSVKMITGDSRETGEAIGEGRGGRVGEVVSQWEGRVEGIVREKGEE